MRYIGIACGFSSVAVVMLALGQPVSMAQPPAPAPVGSMGNAQGNIPGEDVLTRGPLHEAFAAPVNLSGVVPPIVAKKPPEPINETPSGYRPEGDGAAWIPGYWDWDDQSGNFIWVSGIWRNPPPDRQWIGGYWTQSGNGFQRTPGFWAGADTEEVQYFPQPPAPQEQGPPSEAPSADAFWSPGCWAWQGNQYTWTTGFWTTARPGWVWTPTSYSWTPRGYALANGYWDYDLDHRGIAFAPLAVSPTVYQRPGFVFTPSVVIDPGILSFYLFARPAFCQYYFGDYFGAEYDRLGFYPWYAVNRAGAFRYDPLFAYDRWYYAGRDPHWIENLEHWHTYYRGHPDARPPHTFAQEEKLAATRTDRADRRFLSIGQPISSVARNSAFPVRLAPVTAADRTKALDIARSHQAFQTQRSQMEAAARRTTAPGKASLPHREHTITGAVQPAQQPNRREVFKPVVPGSETRPPAVPNRQPPVTSPQPLPRPEVEHRGNSAPVSPSQAEHRRPEPQPQPQPQPEHRRPEPQPQPQPAPRHPQAPEAAPPAHSQPAPVRGGVPEKDKKPGKG